MAHEWLGAHSLRPQTHAYAWLGAVAVFGPLWLHTDSLLKGVLENMHTSDDDSSDPLDSSSNHSSDGETVASDATAPAGKGMLQQQKLAGTYRKHQ